ncbi:sugar ABC transporter substrate-binding protein [Rhizomonospora bruguierae]|uniref:sugar ABC transporter substrate-binding protein n=1 Tax=Rhizomonospora bruguierae TaxID=1581705 RepID=UPI001BD033AA|nr:substrate-binding domain-containing protein [Micromonospora sp. NBRC 107566]
MTARPALARLVATVAATATAAALALAGTGCEVTRADPTQLTAQQGFKIGVLLPDTREARYERADRPAIESTLQRLCPRCEIFYQNAAGDPARQQTQAETMLTQGVRALILDPVHATRAARITAAAKAHDVPVVAYDRLPDGPVTYHVGFDARRVGELQAQFLLKAIAAGGATKRGPIVMINGPASDPNAALYRAGARAALSGHAVIARELTAADWTPERAREQMDQALKDLGDKKIIGVYAANDSTAAGAIAALATAKIQPMPPVTGQDAELSAVQRLLTGAQYMTVYKAIRPEAEAAARMAVAAATRRPYTDQPTVPRRNSTGEVPSVLLAPVVVTQQTIRATLLADAFYSREQICTAAFEAACRAARL